MHACKSYHIDRDLYLICHRSTNITLNDLGFDALLDGDVQQGQPLQIRLTGMRFGCSVTAAEVAKEEEEEEEEEIDPSGLIFYPKSDKAAEVAKEEVKEEEEEERDPSGPIFYPDSDDDEDVVELSQRERSERV
jgi:hypothetical protein